MDIVNVLMLNLEAKNIPYSPSPAIGAGERLVNIRPAGLAGWLASPLAASLPSPLSYCCVVFCSARPTGQDQMNIRIIRGHDGALTGSDGTVVSIHLVPAKFQPYCFILSRLRINLPRPILLQVKYSSSVGSGEGPVMSPG